MKIRGHKRAAGTEAVEAAKAEPEDFWFSDPKLQGLVKSQVENDGLVNLRRTQFVKTAITLFSHKGFNSTTVKEIADAANVSPGLIYQYVTDKEDILFLALQLIVHKNKRVLPAAIAESEHPIQQFIAAFNAYCRVIDENRDAVMLTYRETKSLRAEQRDAIKNMELETNRLIEGCVQSCVNLGYFRETTVELFVYHTIMVAHGWALKHWRLREVTDFEEYLRFNLDLLLSSVLTNDGWRAYAMLLQGSTRRSN